eukprot:Hpha_TRINITY_DN29878_c0_g1::TRINITY_DN29878_c0_g1_i1::g.2965::m.2965/K19675/IFT43; intraflagellar transport protein 43
MSNLDEPATAKPSHGRRARGERERDRDRDGEKPPTDGPGGDGPGASATADSGEGPAAGRRGGPGGRTGGWDTGPSQEQKEREQREEAAKLEEASKHWGVDETGQEAGAIPSLDGPSDQPEEQEDLTRVVAEAPPANTAVQGPQELEKEGMPHLPDAGHDHAGIDTLVLQQCICTQRDNDDDHWHPEQLFHDLAIQLQREKDEKLEEVEEKVKEAPMSP